jgi:hypothetical protein
LLQEIQDNREASNLFVERESIVGGGTRQLRESVDVGEASDNKISGGAVRHGGG